MDIVFKNKQSKICGRQPLENLTGYGLLKQIVSLQIFKGCLPQISLGPLLNTWTRIISYSYPVHRQIAQKKIFLINR